MRSRAIVVVVLLAVVAAVVFLFLSMQDDGGVAPAAPRAGTAAAVAPVKEAPASEARKRSVRPGHKWVQIGEGEVTGVVREYGSENPLGGLAVTLVSTAPGPERTLTATTQADGRFHVGDVPNYEDWMLRVDAREPLADVELGGVNVVENRVSDLGVVYVTPGFSLEGTVVDETGLPVEGADVRMLRATTGASQVDILRLIREVHLEPPAVDRASSDAQGKFKLEKTAPGSYDVKVVRRGRRVHVERGLLVTPQSAKTPLRFVLEKGFQLEGRVVRNGPGAIEGITISAFRQPQDQDFLVLDRVFATTDAEGKFLVDGLGAGRHIVAAIPEGEPFKFSDDVQIPARGPLEIVLESDAWLEGRVTGSGGMGVPGANVYVARFEGSQTVGTARTDAEGRYAIRGLTSGPVQLFLVQAEGYATWPTDLMKMMTSGKQQGEVLAPGRNERNVSLELGGTVTGVVRVKDTEEPIAGVRVELVSILAMFGGKRGATTDADGKFELTSVPLGDSFLVLSKDGWFQPGVSPMTIAMGMGMGGRGKTGADTGKGPKISIADPGQKVTRTYEMAHGSTVSGQVVAPDGAPVAGARVQLVAEASGMGGMMDMFNTFFGTADPALSDAEGRYKISGPPPGQKARVVAKSQGWLEGRSDVVSAAAGDAVADVTVKLRQGASLEGTITDERNKAIAGAFVRWVKMDDENDWSWQWQLRQAQPALTDAEGRYRIAGVETGKIAVAFSHPQHLEVVRKDLAGEEGKALVADAKLVLGSVVTGKVTSPDGKAVSGATVSMSRAQVELGFQFGNDGLTTDAQGAFRAEGLASGAWSFQAQMKGYAPSDSVKVAVGTGGEVTLRLHPAYRIAGIVRAGGQPAANATVTLNEMRAAEPDDDAQGAGAPAGMQRQQVDNERTDAQGRFTFEGVRDGVYEIDAQPGWWGEDRANIQKKTVKDVRAGMENVAIDCEAGLTISGKVLLPDGGAAPAGQVSGHRAPVEGEEQEQGDNVHAAMADGVFELVGLKPGKWMISVEAPGFATKQLQVEAGAKDVRFQLVTGGKLAGRVLNADGTAAAHIWVHAQGAEGGKGAQTDEDGRYEIAGLPAGTVTVNANAWDPQGKQARNAVSGAIDVRAELTTNVPDLTLQAVKIEDGDD